MLYARECATRFKRIFSILVVLFFCSIFSTFSFAEQGAMSVEQEIAQRIRHSLKLTKEEKEWLQTQPVIKVGIDGGYAPYSFLDSSGDFIGAAPDYLSIIAMSLGVQFEPVPNLSWPQIVKGAKERSLDVIATAVITPERETFLEFTQIYLPTPLVIMTRKEKGGIASANELDGKNVALVEGYSSSKRVLKEHPAIISNPVSTPLEGLQKLASGEVDAYVGVLGVNFYMAQKHGLTNLKVGSRYDLQNNGQRFAVRSDAPELTSILDKVLNEFTPQDHNYVMNKWVPVDATGLALNYTEAAPLEWTDEERKWLDEHPEITIGAMNAWPPMDYVDEQGDPIGIGAQFINALNLRLNGALKITSADWPVIYQGVQDRELDALIGITPQKIREGSFNFTKPYVTVPHVIFARKGSEYIADLNALAGKTVALERGFFLKGIIQSRYPTVSVIEYENTSDALDSVLKGESDAYIGNRAVAMYIIHHELIPNLEEHGKIKETSSINAIGIRKDWPILQQILQKALDNITVKERLAILQWWVEPNALGSINSVELSVSEWAWLDNHPIIRVAGDPHWNPIEYRDKQGNFKGIAVEYLDLLSQLLGVQFEYDLNSSWEQGLERLNNGELDMLSAAAETPSRKKIANFIDPYLSLPIVVFTRDNVSYISGLDNLEERKVAVVRGYAVTEMIRRGGWNLEMVEVDSISEGLDALQDGEVFAYVGTILATSHYLRKKGYSNIRVSGQTPYNLDVSMASRSDWPILATILNKTMAKVSETQKSNIAARWIGVQIKEAPDYSPYWRSLAVAFFIIAMFFIWNRFLSKRNEAQSREIKAQNSDLLRSQERLAEAQRVARLGSWRWDIKSGDFSWSDELYRILGCNHAERPPVSTFKRFLAAVYSEDRSQVEQQLFRCLETHKHISFDHRIERPGGCLRHVEEHVEAVFDETGAVVTMTGTVLDVTERKEAEREVRKLHQAFDNSPISIVITDLNGEIEYVNPHFTEITGYSFSEIEGQNPSILSTGHTSVEEYEELWRTILEGKVWRGEFRNQRKNGELYWENATIAPVLDDSGKLVNFLGLKQDITQQKEIEALLFKEANFSSLTKQPNRSYLLSQVEQNIRAKKPIALLLIDMVNLKRINDSLGVDAGDAMIVQAAERLNAFAEPRTSVGHLGGGQFLLVIETPKNLVLEALSNRIVGAFKATFDVFGESVHQVVSVGIALYPEDALSAKELLSRAHAAMTQAKQVGTSHAYFSEQSNREAQAQLHMEGQLRQAINRNELSVYCQPQVDKDGRFLGAEALARWHSSEGFIPPELFIPVAEQSDLILEIGRWVINDSCRQAAKWRDEAGFSEFTVAINMSPRQFLDQNISVYIESCLARYQLEGRQVEIEVTEGLFIEDEISIQTQIMALKKLGVSLSLDDFGTGYSSLQYLRRYPFDTLKIDRSFIMDLSGSAENENLVRAITSMGKALGLQTVAEGVETEEQMVFLREIDCQVFQGFLYGKPMPEEAFMNWLNVHSQKYEEALCPVI